MAVALQSRRPYASDSVAWDAHIYLSNDPSLASGFSFLLMSTKARYVVVGDIDKRWTFLQPGVADIANQLVEEKWPVVWQGRFYFILENPNLKAD